MRPGSRLPSQTTHLKPWGCVQALRLSSTSRRCLVACAPSWGCSDGAQLLSEAPSISCYPCMLWFAHFHQSSQSRRMRASRSLSVDSEQFIIMWT